MTTSRGCTFLLAIVVTFHFGLASAIPNVNNVNNVNNVINKHIYKIFHFSGPNQIQVTPSKRLVITDITARKGAECVIDFNSPVPCPNQDVFMGVGGCGSQDRSVNWFIPLINTYTNTKTNQVHEFYQLFVNLTTGIRFTDCLAVSGDPDTEFFLSGYEEPN